MSAPGEAKGRSIDDQLLMDIQSFISAGGDLLRFADLRSCFASVEPVRVLDAIVELETRGVIELSIAHRSNGHTSAPPNH